MIQRYDLIRVKYTDDYIIDKIDNGDYVLYTDHLAALEEKDKEIERLTEELESHSWEISPAMAQQRIDNLWSENKRLERDILMLVRLCLSNGIISRGLACEYLGCAREDLDDVIKEDSDGYTN